MDEPATKTIPDVGSCPDDDHPMRSLGSEPSLPFGLVSDVCKGQVFARLGLTPRPSRRFGRYTVLGVLGRGGMGTVLRAYDEQLDRNVAIKVLHVEASVDDRLRLRREARALAKLSHPNVVQVYEIGHSEGRTYIVMELVRGRTLLQWARDEPRPDWRACVRAYLQAGAGLAAAHAQGLVHRDFKPGNAIIDDRDHVRVLDFGLARRDRIWAEAEPAKQPEPGSEETALETTLTRTGTVMGTPAYMPLEQFEGKPTEPSGDQFSFCVSLWEALHGQRPFAGLSLEELRAAIAEGRLTAAPRPRRVPGRLLEILVRGLSPEPAQRWPSMEVLLEQLRRLVAPSTGGRIALGLGVLGGLAIVGAGVAHWAEVGRRCTGAGAQLAGVWNDARRQEVRNAILGTGLPYAEDTRRRVEARLDAYARAWVDHHVEACRATAIRGEQTESEMQVRMSCLRERRAALDAAVIVLARSDDAPVHEAVELVEGLPALELCDRVDVLQRHRERVPPPRDPAVAERVEQLREQLALAQAEQQASRYAIAIERTEPMVEQAEQLDYPPVLAEVELRYGALLGASGRYERAEQVLRRAHTLAVEHEHDEVAIRAAKWLAHVVGVERARPAEGLVWAHNALPLARRSQDLRAQADVMNALGAVLLHQGDPQNAEHHLRRALELQAQVSGADHLDLAGLHNNLAGALMRQGRYEEALLQLEHALAIKEAWLGPEHVSVAESLANLGGVLSTRGQPEEALRRLERALSIKERALGSDHPSVMMLHNNMGSAYSMQGRYELAAQSVRRALEGMETNLGAEHPSVAMAMNNLGFILLRRHEYAQAEDMLRRALQIEQQTLGLEHSQTIQTLGNLGEALEGQGHDEEAEPLYRRARQSAEQSLGAEHDVTAWVTNHLGNLLAAQGRHEEAEPLFQQARQAWEHSLGAEHPEVAEAIEGLGRSLHHQGRYEEAEAQLRAALLLRAQALGADHPSTVTSALAVAEVLVDRGALEEAEAQLHRLLEPLEGHPDAAAARLGLARIALARGDHEAAQQHAEQACSIREASGEPPWVLAEARFVLARALWPREALRPRARALARQARDAYAEAGAREQDARAELARWLARHPVP